MTTITYTPTILQPLLAMMEDIAMAYGWDHSWQLTCRCGRSVRCCAHPIFPLLGEKLDSAVLELSCVVTQAPKMVDVDYCFH